MIERPRCPGGTRFYNCSSPKPKYRFIHGALAEFERDIIRERTQAGLLAARARGRKGGRPKALTPKKAQMVQDLYRNKENSIDEICKTLNISRTTLYRYLQLK
jgi:DNA invertase Pin-like site-specific DNA recombinase